MINSDPLRNKPVPTVEEHYHIRDLIARQEARTADRNDHREREKAKLERMADMRDAKPVTITDFYCEQCRKDFKSHAVLHVEHDWNCEGQLIAFYKAKCRTCTKWCMRLVLDKHKDTFYFRSKAVHVDRGKHHEDLIQPHETGFNLLYGKRK